MTVALELLIREQEIQGRAIDRLDRRLRRMEVVLAVLAALVLGGQAAALLVGA